MDVQAFTVIPLCTWFLLPFASVLRAGDKGEELQPQNNDDAHAGVLRGTTLCTRTEIKERGKVTASSDWG